MHRISTDIDYLKTGQIIIDADGIPVDLGYRGTGSPEGKVAAPVGSVYTDLAATNGAIRWIKTSGTGTTGWRDYYGDINKSLETKADQSVITGATHQVGRTDTRDANKLVKLDENGKLYISRHSIINDSDPVNKIYVDTRAPIDSFAGTGSPEGKIAASVGTVYTDTAATNGAIRWIKASGTGSTGWKVEYGDTGWRDITALMGDSVTGGNALLRRVNDTVWLNMKSITYTASSSYHLLSSTAIPIGFRVRSGYEYFNTTSRQAFESQGPFRVSQYGDLGLYDATGKTSFVTYVSWSTVQGWPATLPGLPA